MQQHTIAYKAGYIAARKGKPLQEAIASYKPGSQFYDDYKAGYKAFQSEGVN